MGKLKILGLISSAQKKDPGLFGLLDEKVKQIPFQCVTVLYTISKVPTISGWIFHCYVRLPEGKCYKVLQCIDVFFLCKSQDEVQKVPLPKGTSVKAGTRIPGVIRLITNIISSTTSS